MAPVFIVVCVVLIGAKWGAQIALEWVNQQHVKAHSGAVPAAFAGIVTPENYAKAVKYTLAKSRFEMIQLTWTTVVLAVTLLSGVLPALYRVFHGETASIWVGGAFLLSVGLLLSVFDLPFDWYSQFRLEERFGFNTTTIGTWCADRLKGVVLACVLGYPLVVLILKLAAWLGSSWWFWAWVCMVVFQLVLMVVAPVLIMPLFNKFTALPDGALRAALFALGERAGFRTRDIQVMDGSKRSRHSNAFFTGLGKFRKIVLFDTLVEQLEQDELESVLAHEIGHFKKGHIPKMMAMSFIGTLPFFYLAAVLAKSPWFLNGFGFPPQGIAPALLLIALLAGLVTFWLSPIFHILSRRYEYEADAFAANLLKRHQPLIAALRKLNEKNLSNLTPHPFYSGFYYSHPTFLEREAALAAINLNA